ncbi:hypothetical protein FZ983_27650 [Azospirillum sp. B21]|uniref:hypothetical protein n=1 Tax=Azospirillum sp. B21 TaxID=2607496 RepID=UPI0011EC828E|nr:hypothetical protein [Azospirillum sp. B21]KAA0574675.1 hypothetical protein FZ983_27650 [Azospirillum sp. B21]
MPKSVVRWGLIAAAALIGTAWTLWTVPVLVFGFVLHNVLERSERRAAASAQAGLAEAERRVTARIQATAAEIARAKKEIERRASSSGEDNRALVHIEGLGSVGMQKLMDQLDESLAMERRYSRHSDMLWH